jgi:hypothetical protein
MPSWTETQEFLRARFKLEQDTPEQLKLSFITQLVPDRNEAQEVSCALETQNGEPWLLMRADVCREPSLEPLEALRLGARLRIGGVALVDEVYEVRRAYRLRDLDLEVLAESLQYLALEASFLRTRARPLPEQPPPTPPPGEAEPEAATGEDSTPGGHWAQ